MSPRNAETDMPQRVDIEAREVCHDGVFRLERYRLRHALFRGGMSAPLSRELFERGHAVAVLPYDPRTDVVVLIEQFRVGALARVGGPWLVEIVAGVIDGEEAPEVVARREAIEEAGLELGRLEKICRFYVSPGGTSESIHLYCGEVDAEGAGGIHGLAEEGEDIRVFSEDAEAALARLARGEIDSASPVIALQWLALNRARLRREWARDCYPRAMVVLSKRPPAPVTGSTVSRLGKALAVGGLVLVLSVALLGWLALIDSGPLDLEQISFAPEAFVELIRGWGAWGVAGSLALMVLHSFVPFPAECLALANGMVFGLFWGSLITWSGAMLGAWLAFGLARTLGRPFVGRVLPARHRERIDAWSGDHGWSALLAARLVPVIAFNLINYA
ncbi:MAG: NUDIX domain-containing protein, partial [Gammaproteobacteria bacterium]|nr:NUDIX domain-containing protein [Gammaproteobacteria bacterium]